MLCFSINFEILHEFLGEILKRKLQIPTPILTSTFVSATSQRKQFPLSKTPYLDSAFPPLLRP